MKMGFIGLGVVGKATMRMALDGGHTEFSLYDPALGHKDSMNDCNMIFICVPVPTLANGKQDLSALQSSLEMCPVDSTVFVRSSILPGTCQSLKSGPFSHLHIYALPEFLTERTADADALKLPLVAPQKAIQFLQEAFPNKEIISVKNSREAEFVKYIHNGFCAVKVGFFNTMFEFAKNKHIDYESSVAAACGVTGFIEPTHTKVPGPDGKLGFGGKCLAKDLYAFLTQIENTTSNEDPFLKKDTFLRQVFEENLLLRANINNL